MSATKKQLIRFGVIGPGRAASRFAVGVAAVEAAEIAAVWGRNPERASANAASFSVPAIAPGKHILCEKPAALNVAQLERIIASARSRDRLFMEAMKPPFIPLYQN